MRKHLTSSFYIYFDLLFSSNIENQTIKKKEASTKNLETKVFVLIENENSQTKR